MKVLVVGGGPGGYVAAIRAAQLGARVTLVEKGDLGGTCLNVGCIPTKVLLHAAELYTAVKKDTAELGIQVQGVTVDWQQVQQRKNQVVGRLVEGVAALLQSNQIQVVKGEASFTGPRQAAVQQGEKRILVDFDGCILATGSRAWIPPIPGKELPGVITSDEALSLPEIPKSLLVIGGGVIGCEFASIYRHLGARVTIIEALPQLIANMDQEIVAHLKKALEQDGVEVCNQAKVERIEEAGAGLGVTVNLPEGPRYFEAEKVLVAVGRRPTIEGLDLEKAGLFPVQGRLETNQRFQTRVPHLYAIGDCRGGVMLAHVASAEGMAAAEAMMGVYSKIDFRTIPYAVYTKPELGAVGLTEAQARAAGYPVKTGVFPLYANGKSLIMGETNGIVKYVVDGETDEILGLHMAGPRATELIVEGGLALRLEATIEEIVTTIHAHPTVGESLQEAAHAVWGGAIHLPR